jgi:hypothetical protein
MADYTDEVTDCALDVVYAIDVLDVARHLISEHISLDQNLEQCGFGPQKCSYLQLWVNKRRSKATAPKKDPLKKGTIKPGTTIRKVIDYVCG